MNTQNYFRWVKANEIELKARYRDYRLSIDYSPYDEVLTFDEYCCELFKHKLM